MKFYVTYERPEFFQVEVEADNEAEAEAKADAVIDKTNLDKLWFARGEIELTHVEQAS